MEVLRVFLLLVIITLARTEEIQVETTLGRINGLRIPFEYSDNLLTVFTTIDTFYSIPYAEPPIGNYRFMKTVPKEPWQDVWNSTKKRAICWQAALNIAQDEDCLHLNIWTPSIESKGLPVMVWIHGGAFVLGSSVTPQYDGSVLAAIQDVIVVSMNYRLNAFGFLYAGESAKGNYGLWDQHEAIKWTYNHIEEFGGDPNQITIFGQSAGGGSSGHQLMAEQNEGYFNRAILMSGGMVHPWAIELDYDKAKGDAYLVGENCGCGGIESDEELVDCLRGRGAQRLALAANRVVVDTLTVVIPLVPVVDGEFITNDPNVLLDQGRFKHCDVMMGTTTNDGTLMGARAYFGDINNPDPYSDYDDFHNRIKNYTYTYRNDIILSAIEQQYLDWSNFDDVTFNHFDTYNEILTDEAFYCPTDKIAKTYAKHNNSVYVYLFNHLPENTFYDIPGVSWPWKGIAHAEDIPFVFGKPFSSVGRPNLTYSEEEKTLSLDMMRYYTNFVKTGNPNFGDSSGCWTGGACHWTNYDVRNQTIKSFEIPLQDKSAYRAEFSHFWNNYLPKQLVTFTADGDELQRQWDSEFDRWRTDDLAAWRKEHDSYQDVADQCSTL
ncbi:acetylcholinesterase-like [Apostichopus japonicus]|uniref:acetylcholinesterase-like n=1 Tax=Stichopus japonicus TaxID=307972 RepID=UPI003AB2734A